MTESFFSAPDTPSRAKLRVLHVAPYYPPDRIGGVGEVVAHIHRALLAHGHESTVVTTGASTDDPSVRRVSSSPSSFWFASARYASLAREAHVVHIHHGEGAGLLAALRACAIKTPILLTLHVNVGAMRKSLGAYRIKRDTYCRDTLRNWAYRHITMRARAALDGVATSLADRVTFISRSAAIDTLGPEAGRRATVIYNGVPSAITNEESAAPPVELLFVGTNTERKRVELLPTILAHVRQRQPVARLRIIGLSEDTNSEIISRAHTLGVLDAIEFAGKIRAEEIARHYRAARVLLVPSAYEGLPMVILEAMQHRLPVVATSVSGHPEVIESGVNGFLVPLDDPAAMAAAALRILDDELLGERLGAAGESIVREHFSVDRQVAEYLAEYERLAISARTAWCD